MSMNERPSEGLTYIVNHKVVLMTEVHLAIMGINWIGKATEVFSKKEVHLNGLEHKLTLVPSLGGSYLMDTTTEIVVDDITFINSDSILWTGSATVITTGETISINSYNLFEEIV